MYMPSPCPPWSSDASLQDDLQAASECDLPVLISIDSGSVAMALARWIHERSLRAAVPIVMIDAATTTAPYQSRFLDDLHASANAWGRSTGTTLLVTHIERMSPPVQEDMLRFMDRCDGVVGGRPVRVIATARQSTFTCVQGGRFREDLFYRLNVIHIRLGRLRSVAAALSGETDRGTPHQCANEQRR
jgi:two-component system response regulator FlrC